MRVGMSTWARLRICLGMAHGASGGGSGWAVEEPTYRPVSLATSPTMAKILKGFRTKAAARKALSDRRF
ncbi:MAG: hypothetical protein QOE02_5727 [Rhodospirillaceae bacterium]|jgi:hypothetical protein|nr:hypothetical protein [Rhodospirillaceae bacterium]